VVALCDRHFGVGADGVIRAVRSGHLNRATVGKRGAAIIEARGLSSAASAANAAIDHMRDWALGTNGKWVTMGVASHGWYGIPKEVMFGFPVTCEGGEYKVVEGLPIDAFSQSCIDKTLKELTDEQAGVAHLI
jgi:malate dehydrogenase